MSLERETWVAIENDFPDHPKIVRAGSAAGWAHLCAICYADRFRTNGFIPEVIAWRILHQDGWMDEANSSYEGGGNVLLGRLLEANLWEQVEGGYQIHDYLKHQRNSDDIRALRRIRAEAGRRGGLASGEARRSKSQANRSKGQAEAESESEEEKEKEQRTTLPLEQELGKARLLSAIGERNNGLVRQLETYKLPPAAWFAAAEELEQRGKEINNRAGYAVQLFKDWCSEQRYKVSA